MARLSPYLQMLLAKRGNNAQPLDTSVTADSATGNSGPVTLQPQPAPSVAPTTNLDPLIQVQPRSPLESATDDVRRYGAGLHPDSEYPAIWTPHKRNRGLEIAEGIGNVAASAVGVDLQRILHPRGTPEQQAHRRLRDESQIEGVELQQRRTAADEQSSAATVALKDRQIEEMNKPKVEADREVGGVVIRKRGEGYETVYKPEAKPERPTDVHVGNRILRRGADDKYTSVYEAPEAVKDEEPDATGPLGEQESRFRANADAATAAANKAEADVKLYIQQQSAAKPDYDPASDANVTSMTAEAKRQRDFAADQTKRADDLTVDKIKAGNKQKKKLDPTLEKQVREAAAAKGLNPDIAVQRALSRQ